MHLIQFCYVFRPWLGLCLVMLPISAKSDEALKPVPGPAWEMTTSNCAVRIKNYPWSGAYIKFYDRRAITWSGACVDGHASGPGVLVQPEAKGGETRIEAPMRDGVINGTGTMTLSDGATVSGNWVDGDLEGDIAINSPSNGLHSRKGATRPRGQVGAVTTGSGTRASIPA